MSDKTKKIVRGAGKAGPFYGAILGAFPQCGFSAAASSLYSSRIITLGTLISIYLSTSDEMLPILISQNVGIIPILKILGFLFIIYIALFIANMSGYYESKIRDQVIVTEEGIKEFEEKIQNGEEIDITSFLNNEREDYSSKCLCSEII